MSIVIRGMKNVLRNPLRLILVVLLLGVSLMFVAAMVSLNSSAQQQLANVHKEVGTAITINYSTNEGGGFGPNSTSGQNNSPGGNKPPGQNNSPGGNTPQFGRQGNTTPMPNSTVDTVKKVPGAMSVEESLVQSDTDGILKTSTFQSPNGQTFAIPPRVNGISNGATHFTLAGSGTPTIVSGRGFQDSDANAPVAMMSKKLADQNNLTINSTFTLKGTKITIIGLYTTTSQFADNTLVLPLKTVQTIYAVNGIDSVTVYAGSYEQVETLATKLRNALGSKYDVTTQDTLYANTFSGLNAATNSIQLALIVSIITAAAVIIFAVFILVRERTTEIGTLKAIGASHWQVIGQFWSEVLSLSILAALIAVILLATLGPVISQKFDVSTATTNTGGPGGPGGFGRGFFAARAGTINNVHLAAATLNPQTLLIIIGLGIALAILTSIIPAWFVARIKPAEVLRKGN